MTVTHLVVVQLHQLSADKELTDFESRVLSLVLLDSPYKKKTSLVHCTYLSSHRYYSGNAFHVFLNKCILIYDL